MTIIILLILTAVLWGSTPIIEKIGLGTGINPFTAVAVRSFAISLILLIILTVTGKIKEVFTLDAKTILIFITSGILAGLLGMWTYYHALQKGATSKIVPIAATYPLVSAFLSVIILKEEVTLIRVMGTIFIVIGIWLVK